MKPYKTKIKTNLIIIIVLFVSISSIFAIVKAESDFSAKSGQIIIDEPLKNGSFFISANISQNDIISPVLKADFPFNSLAVEWSEPEMNFDLYIRFLNENWSGWHKVRFDDDYNGKDGSTNNPSSQLISTKLTDSFQYKLIKHSQNIKLDNLKFIYLNTTHGPKGQYKIAANSSDLNIISRSQWGANESYKYQNGADIWQEQYYLPKKFIIHHTAGDNGINDPKATIRAIHYYHAISRGWGDIGYNYIIDTKGNIYEGRKGGDGVVAGHAYMNNQNSIGIALLGCYDQNACNKPDDITPAALNSLQKLIAYKSKEFNIYPGGTGLFNDKNLPNIIGHRDVGNTNCPGDLLYQKLDEIKFAAAGKLTQIGGFNKPLPADAQFVSLSTDNLTIEQTKNKSVKVKFKNTGQAVWRGYEDAGLFLAASSIKNKMARIGSVSIASKKYNQSPSGAKYRLLEGNVYPGETGTFEITFNAPAIGQKSTKDFTLAWLNKGYFPNTDFSVAVTGIECTDCIEPEQEKKPIMGKKSPVYAASLLNSTFPVNMTADDLQNVSIKFKNSGNQNLNQQKLKLKIIYANTHISPFRNSSWYSEWAMIIPDQKLIKPNQLASFNFKLKSPNVVGQFPHTIILMYNDLVLYQFNKTIDITAAYKADITESTLPIAMKNTWSPNVKITFTNTGTKAWINPVLKSTDHDGTNSWFRADSWQDNKTIATKWQTVQPGQSISYEFKFNPYWNIKPNTYPHVYLLSSEGNEIYINGYKKYLTHTRVDY